MLWTARSTTRTEQPIASRIGLGADASRFGPGTNLWIAVRERHREGPLACVLIDEAQFLTATQAWHCARLADEGNIPMLCYGLRTDISAATSSRLGVLLGIADTLVELKAVLQGRKATMNLRTDEHGEPVARRRADADQQQRPVPRAVPPPLCRSAVALPLSGVRSSA